MQRVEAEVAVSVSDLKKSPTAIVDEARGAPVAILNHNRVMAYMVPAETYEAMMERLDDMALVEIVRSRAGEKSIPVDAGKHQILGTTKDGVRSIKPKGRATHFTQRELRAAIRTVRTEKTAV
ncbi:MAG: type II toxin-antitoxin system Phd/YefM family antitoxin [Caulobacteraceae bacterium]|nr:type II toxin-antitoxin system Phd/YefM family antitoxin [Caulobacteraceae bacterium]